MRMVAVSCWHIDEHLSRMPRQAGLALHVAEIRSNSLPMVAVVMARTISHRRAFRTRI
jgi:hypothetical protein